MEEKIQKLLENKYENLVQFNVTNTTSNPIFLDLFNTSDLAVIPTSPTYIYPPNSVVGTFGSAIYTTGIFTNNGYYYTQILSSNQIEVFDTNYNLFTTLTFATVVNSLVYNDINNTLYVALDTILTIDVIDCSTNTLITSISTTQSCINGTFNSYNNNIYYTSNSFVFIIDCNLNIQTSTLPLPLTFGALFYLIYNPFNNLIYCTDNGISNNVAVLDTQTNTYLPNIPLPVGLGGGILTLNEFTNNLYIAQTDIGVVDCVTNTFLYSIPITIGIFPLFGCVDTLNNQIYFACQDGSTIILNGTNNAIIQNIALAPPPLIFCAFNPITNSVVYNSVALNNLVQLTTIGITTTSYYISGSSNYNAFLNNLNSEPIEIQMIRLFVQNQEQLYNQLQFTKIDSNGNQIFLPDFPINQVSTMQQQGNIGELSLNDVVFDGRTYINQYQLNANESMSFEIYYTQLDLTSATPTFPIFFKPKIQLKEYIKKELNL